MNMSFSRNCVQAYIENRLGCNDLHKWSSYKSKLEKHILDTDDENKLTEHCFSDALSYYVKAVISFCEALYGLKKKRSSWAVVKFYYSVFYLIRADILLENHFLIRCSGFYYSRVKNNETMKQYKKNNVRGDHQLTTYFYNKLHQDRINIDPLQDGIIDEQLPYLWLMTQREKINYQSKDFSDPEIIECLANPFSYIEEGKEEYLFNMYLASENYTYCFDEEHACIAIPFCKIVDIGNKIFNKNRPFSIPDILSNHIKSIDYKCAPHPIDYIIYGCSRPLTN